MQKSLMILLLLSTNAISKKLKIHRCVLSNGTIAFQEESCKVKYTQTKKPPKIKSNKTRKHKNNKKITEQNPKKVKYIKKYNVDVSDKTSNIISSRVKGYSIAIKVLNRWGIINKVFHSKLVHMKFLDEKPGSKMSLLIDYIFPDNKKFSDQELVDLINLVGSRYAKGSKEQYVNTHLLDVAGGKGAMATFTNSSIVDDYRYASKGVLFKGKWLIQFTLLSNNLNSYSHKFALHSITNTISIRSNNL